MKKGFTLIELLAVIVILAIIAVIAVPIVLNIIDESKENSNKRSIDMYSKAVENAVASYKLNGNSLIGEFTTTDGKTVVSKNDSNVKFEVDYTGSKVVCSTFKIYDNGKFYLSDCKVDNVIVDDYSKGEKHEEKVCTIERADGNKYSVGDIVTCQLSESIDKFYIIEEQPLTVTHIQMLTENSIDPNTYRQNNRAMATPFSTDDYWSSSTPITDVYDDRNDGAKPIVDNYVNYLNKKLNVATGKLLTLSQAETLGCSSNNASCAPGVNGGGNAPSWVYSTSYYTGSYIEEWGIMLVSSEGSFYGTYDFYVTYAEIRPVITIPTSSLN